MKDKTIFVMVQETWNAEKCLKASKYRRTNAFGDKGFQGIIAASASTSPEYGQTVTYNGGTIRDGKWYSAVHNPLPKIPKDYEFHNVVSWGTAIRKKLKVQPCLTFPINTPIPCNKLTGLTP
jgi:hypothetical protein